MTRLILLGALCVLASPALGGADETCLECHARLSPVQIEHYRQSAHADRVGCSDCHGDDHAALESGRVRVTAEVCGRCHAEELAEHRHSKHGQGLHTGWGCSRNQPDRDPQGCAFCHLEGSTRPVSRVQCARFLTQSAEMQQAGCNRCHLIEDSCAACHSSHQTDPALVRAPGVCAKCHMGPDHPQWEMWQTSQHGQLYAAGGAPAGPGCQACHMPAGSHDVSFGITASPAGKPLVAAERTARRREMEQLCGRCHAPGFVADELRRGDRIREQSQALVDRARAIIADLWDRGLLEPSPEARPAHPLRGATLVLDSQMLYEDLSHIERLFFKMMKYDFARAWKGAFHQNPAYTHWYGNAELKLTLADIEAEAARLRRQAGDPAPIADSVEEELLRLKRRFERGALDAAAYAEEKARLLETLPAGRF